MDNWSKCSSECGDGIKKRKITCRNTDEIAVDEKLCKSNEKPEDTAKCVENPNCLKWITGSWSEVVIKKFD